MKLTKKLLSLALVGAMALTTAACGGNNNNSGGGNGTHAFDRPARQIAKNLGLGSRQRSLILCESIR